MIADDAHLRTAFAADARDLMAAQRLRYSVFVEELGGDGALVDHGARLERDAFDDACEHLLLIDSRRDPAALDHVVGVYRLMTDAAAARLGRFYCDDEYDLTLLRASGRRLLELGRSCVRAEYRGGTSMFLMWNALAEYVLDQRIEVLFGVASFHGTDVAALAQPLSYLHHHHLAPGPLRVPARGLQARPMDMIAAGAVDRRAAMAATPALIKAYLRLGGFVGQGAYVDAAFNTTDVCLLMDTARMSERHKSFYVRRGATAA